MKRGQALAHLALVAALFALPLVLTDFGTHIANLALIYVTLAVGLSLALGYAGQVNLAQAACFGMGAYTTALACWESSERTVLAGLRKAGLPEH